MHYFAEHLTKIIRTRTVKVKIRCSYEIFIQELSYETFVKGTYVTSAGNMIRRVIITSYMKYYYLWFLLVTYMSQTVHVRVHPLLFRIITHNCLIYDNQAINQAISVWVLMWSECVLHQS